MHPVGGAKLHLVPALLDRAIELSSMGIRVDAAALERQLKIRGCEERCP